jgi:hypothetical protein
MPYIHLVFRFFLVISCLLLSTVSTTVFEPAKFYVKLERRVCAVILRFLSHLTKEESIRHGKVVVKRHQVFDKMKRPLMFILAAIAATEFIVYKSRLDDQM